MPHAWRERHAPLVQIITGHAMIGGCLVLNTKPGISWIGIYYRHRPYRMTRELGFVVLNRYVALWVDTMGSWFDREHDCTSQADAE